MNEMMISARSTSRSGSSSRRTSDSSRSNGPFERVEVQLQLADGHGIGDRVLALPDATPFGIAIAGPLRRLAPRLAHASPGRANWCQTK